VFECRADRQTTLEGGFEERVQILLESDDPACVGEGADPVVAGRTAYRLVGKSEEEPDSDLREQVVRPVWRDGS
jgi:hypothetical protein